MDIPGLINDYGLCATVYIVCFVSGFVPLVNAEVFLIGIALMTSRNDIVPVTLLAAAGQMTAKTLIYLAGRGAVRFPLGKKIEVKIVRIQALMHRWQGRTALLLLLSSSVGVPPFYVVSFVAGIGKINVLLFCAAGFAGRWGRFYICVLFPQLIQNNAF